MKKNNVIIIIAVIILVMGVGIFAFIRSDQGQSNAQAMNAKQEQTSPESTIKPTAEPTPEPTVEPTTESTVEPTIKPTDQPDQQQPEQPLENVDEEVEEFAAYVNSNDDDKTTPVETPAPVEEIETDYEVVPMDPTTYYAATLVNLRQGPSADDFVKVGALSLGEEVTVVGVVKEYKGNAVKWYQLSTGEFASANYFSLEKPEVPEAASQAEANPGEATQPSGTLLGDIYEPGDVMEGGATFGGSSEDALREAMENIDPELLKMMQNMHLQ